MNCPDVRRLWNLHYDREGDVELHLRIEEHLTACPDCRSWFDKQSQLEDFVAARLADCPPRAELWNQVLAGAEIVAPEVSRRWMLYAATACGAATALAAIWLANRYRRAESGSLARLTADLHERLSTGAATVEFTSSSDLEVENYLRSRVSFPVRCPPREDAGFIVRGAGTCRLEAEPAAYLAGQVGTSPVSIFVMPVTSLAAFADLRRPQAERELVHARAGTYDVVLSVIDRNAVLVVGPARGTPLDRVISAYGTYPHAH